MVAFRPADRPRLRRDSCHYTDEATAALMPLMSPQHIWRCLHEHGRDNNDTGNVTNRIVTAGQSRNVLAVGRRAVVHDDAGDQYARHLLAYFLIARISRRLLIRNQQ